MNDDRSTAGHNSALATGNRSCPAQVSSKIETLTAELYTKSGALKFSLTLEDFRKILSEIQNKYLAADAGPDEIAQLYGSLRVEELVLARACARGSDAAWEVFLVRYREKLYGAAGAIAREATAARELADSLYADLFGTESRGGERVSKLNSYAGRGSLEGWLRTVLAQEFVNRRRAARRLVSLEEQQEAGVQFSSPAPNPVPDGAPALDPRIEAATDEVLASLPSEDRYILASYYLDGRRLAEIARSLSVHESTISRRVEKTTASVSKAVVKALVRRGMSRRQAEEALEVDVRDLSLDVRKRLVENGASRDPQNVL